MRPLSTSESFLSQDSQNEELGNQVGGSMHRILQVMSNRMHMSFLFQCLMAFMKRCRRTSASHIVMGTGLGFPIALVPGSLPPASFLQWRCCIAHRVFSGFLRSDVMCTSCGFTSTTYDPCVDISLDLELNTTKPASTKSNHSTNNNRDPTNSSQNQSVSTLVGCLDRFTRSERLGSDQKFFCQQCQVRQESLKQMSIRKLPLVSCFHIKRFEHSPIRKMSRKIDRYLQFPLSLDMEPYLSSSILRSRYGNRMFPFEGDEQDNCIELSSQFELFAVITRSGKLDAGHYVTYLRLGDQWYKCDDAWITRVNEDVDR